MISKKILEIVKMSSDLSFRCYNDFEERSRSKLRKKNKPKRNHSGKRKINTNGARLNFCGFCNGKLAIRIANKSMLDKTRHSKF